MTTTPIERGPLRDGERVLLLDARGRRYLVTLRAGTTWHSHGGALALDALIGNPEGTSAESVRGMLFTCFRPRLADVSLKMPRGAQVVYPKDAASIVMEADVAPGTGVLEAGTGSGALTLALARATGPTGRVVTYDLRGEFQDVARENVEAVHGEVPGWIEFRVGDVRSVAEGSERFDRVVLDLPEPWGVLPALASATGPGAIVCAYVPTTVQVQAFVLALVTHGWLHLETFETLHRSWHVTERSVRPDHRMVAHTGFVTIARRTAG